MKKTVLKKYAKLIVEKGVAVKRGQEVIVVAELDQPEFVTMVVDAAYKAGAHRHTPEIEQTLTYLAGEKVKVTFVPHLLPVNRGIESTIYATLNEKGKAMSADELDALWRDFYKNERFVRIEKMGSYANIKNVKMSNMCDISLHTDAHCDTLIISSCIDNMVKGAAGQAVQNMNIVCGFEESSGIDFIPPAF